MSEIREIHPRAEPYRWDGAQEGPEGHGKGNIKEVLDMGEPATKSDVMAIVAEDRADALENKLVRKTIEHETEEANMVFGNGYGFGNCGGGIVEGLLIGALAGGGGYGFGRGHGDGGTTEAIVKGATSDQTNALMMEMCSDAKDNIKEVHRVETSLTQQIHTNAMDAAECCCKTQLAIKDQTIDTNEKFAAIERRDLENQRDTWREKYHDERDENRTLKLEGKLQLLLEAIRVAQPPINEKVLADWAKSEEGEALNHAGREAILAYVIAKFTPEFAETPAGKEIATKQQESLNRYMDEDMKEYQAYRASKAKAASGKPTKLGKDQEDK